MVEVGASKQIDRADMRIVLTFLWVLVVMMKRRTKQTTAACGVDTDRRDAGEASHYAS